MIRDCIILADNIINWAHIVNIRKYDDRVYVWVVEEAEPFIYTITDQEWDDLVESFIQRAIFSDVKPRPKKLPPPDRVVRKS